jgi:hypothetical protein
MRSICRSDDMIDRTIVKRVNGQLSGADKGSYFNKGLMAYITKMYPGFVSFHLLI